MQSINPFQKIGGSEDILRRALEMSGTGAAGATGGTEAPMQSKSSQFIDGASFSEDVNETQGRMSQNPLSAGKGSSSEGIGYNNGSGMVPGFGGMKPQGTSQMNGSNNAFMRTMMMMDMMMMMVSMMKNMGIGSQNINNNQRMPNFLNPINMQNNNSPVNFGTFNPNSLNRQDPMTNTLNALSMMTNGGIGQNGVNYGQNQTNGGGSVSNPTYFTNNLTNVFSQGTEGNCSSIATIKAAMDKFGDKVFDKTEKTSDGGYNLTLKDGRKMKLTADEMKTAKGMANFEGSDSKEKDYATLCYAAMAKGALMERNDGATSFKQACTSINNGEWPKDCARYIGLQDHIMSLDPHSIGSKNDAVVAWSPKHSIYIDNKAGNLVADKYGQSYAYNDTDAFGRDLSGAFTFV